MPFDFLTLLFIKLGSPESLPDNIAETYQLLWYLCSLFQQVSMPATPAENDGNKRLSIIIVVTTVYTTDSDVNYTDDLHRRSSFAHAHGWHPVLPRPNDNLLSYQFDSKIAQKWLKVGPLCSPSSARYQPIISISLSRTARAVSRG